MHLTIDSDKNIVLSQLLEYSNKKVQASMNRVSVVWSITTITTEMKAVIEYKHSNWPKQDKIKK